MSMADFSDLTPDRFLPALEEALGEELDSFSRPFPSYINRVYEIRTSDEKSFVAKFYRPGRWSIDALLDEHAFLTDCVEAEIPVVAPLTLANQQTLGNLDNIAFSVFPKRAGRQFDVEGDDSFERMGSLLGRLHTVGSRRKAPARLLLTPQTTTRIYADQLVADGVDPDNRQKFKDITNRIIDTISPYFDGLETLRIHGDFHQGNVLERPGEGLMVIDFDDMMNGPAVHDFWLLLPDHYPACQYQLELLLSGYRQFRDIPPRSMLIIEGLRAMRMIYFTAWCNMQRNDFQFQTKFPEWGTDTFWKREVQDLQNQYTNMMDAFADRE